MKNSRMIFSSTGSSVRRMLTTPRFYLAIAFNLIIIQQLLAPIRSFCAQSGYRIAPWIFPHLSGQFYIQYMLIIGVVLLFCDAPFIYENTPYLMIRSGRFNWLFGQFAYIFVGCIIYISVIFLSTICLLTPYIEWTLDAGKVINTLAQTDMGTQIGTISFSYELLLKFSPVAGTLVSLFMALLICLFTSFTILAVNIFGKRMFGPIVGTLIAFTPILAYKIENMTIGYYLAPPSWMQAEYFISDTYSIHPSWQYSVPILLLGISISMIMSVLIIKTKTIVVQADDG